MDFINKCIINKLINVQFSRSLSVWWPYIQTVINMDFINKCIIVISRICKVYLFNDGFNYEH